jgi:hypothetical protein
MKNLSLLILLLITFECYYPQSYENSIYGKVISEKTGEPLPYVNIFISNSTWGTTTDSHGFYLLKSIRPGNYELVFSMIGYETEIKSINLNDTSNIIINVHLKEKVYEFDEVKISGTRPEEWFEDLKIFKEKFFGYYSTEINCEIENEFYLEFSHPDENIFIASCEVPLIIKNYTLNYRIQCEILKFEYNYSSKKLDRNYKLYFSDLNLSEGNDQNVKLMRNEVYKNSLYFFLKTLILGTAFDYDIEIYSTVDSRVSSRFQGYQITSIEEILEKNDSSDNYRIRFDDYLHIFRYTDYYLVNESWIKLNYPYVIIDKYGYPLEEFAFTLYGTWAGRGVSTQMPIDFEFEDAINHNEEN